MLSRTEKFEETNIRISMSYDSDREEFDLAKGYVPPDFLASLVPKGYLEEYVDELQVLSRIERDLHLFKQCALIGPTGTGKTHAVYAVAEKHHLPIFEINCSLQTSIYDLIGKYVGLGKENWVDGIVTTWCHHGGILYLDEANMMEQDVAARINSIMDLRGHIVIVEKDSEIVSRHPSGYLVISMNPYSVEYAGTKPLNVAFRRRLRGWISFDYLSVGSEVSPNEVKVVMNRSNLGDENVAAKMVSVGAKLRALYKSGDLPAAPSIANLIDWAMLTHSGEDIMKAAEETIINMMSDDDELQNLVRNVAKSTFGH